MAGISMRELAERLGVSVASVSVALRGKPGISEEKRARIREEAERLGYDRTRLGRVEGRGVIEVVDYTYYRHGLPEKKDGFSYYVQFLDAAAAAIAEKGYSYEGVCSPMDPGFSGRARADGSILLGGGITEEELSGYLSGTAPFVVCGNSLPGLPVNTVTHDNYHGIRTGMARLVELGHKSIGFVCSMGGPAGEERLAAYQYETGRLGLAAPACLDLRGEAACLEPEGCLAWMEKQFAQGLPAVTAYLCDNDFVAAALMRALRGHGKIPGREVSVVGFDDQPFAALLEPPLASVHTYEPDLAAAAVDQLVYCLEHPGFAFRHVKVGTRLIERGSLAGVEAYLCQGV